ncbi:carbohydrate ABC transporter permease [Ruminococcus albus]|uniref:Binding-protein-dependent transport systems inner membrane component n=1 Tax=Ruminococcus albus (strain ATCC 27210 / DSM 20455 / JCM 14654 / NCDO 2250 / 7) TaxID=697329 RepID=E6UCZ2_RUMA7|nr:sugar ABC transporter permease [Ruminococcus albus]ADU20786.1 binding-protein-dependent transport systems inner membrane component [Ruminococcus albus 7 = DSM 20455]
MDKMLRSKKAIVIFMLPAFLLFTLVLFIPIIQSVYYSFCEYKVLQAPKFIGLDNYKAILSDKTFAIAFKNSMFFLIFSCVSQLILGLFYAALLTNIEKGRNLFKNIIYLPCVLSSAALGLLWMFIFSPKLGINLLLEKMGIEGPMWLSDIRGTIILPMWIIAFVALWQYVGQSMMLYMAQISGISKSLMEASYIDGCTKAMTFRYVTLPLIKPMVATAMSLNAIGSLKFFDLIFNMTEGGPNHKTEVLATHLYQQGFKFSKYGYASAIGVVLLILCLAVTLFINKVVKTEQYEM